MFRWLKHRERAQSMVEFALMIPIFLILVFGVIDFGMGLRAYITVAQATRESARYASIGNPGTTSGAYVLCNSGSTIAVVQRACTTMDGLTSAEASVKVNYPNGNSPGNSVTVSARYNYRYITPLRAIVNFLSAGALGSTITVSSSTDMRLE